jgi:excisionase family DNA binding protein
VQAYTVEQVAEMLHIGRDKVYGLLRTGQLRSMKIGKPPDHRPAPGRVRRLAGNTAQWPRRPPQRRHGAVGRKLTDRYTWKEERG